MCCIQLQAQQVDTLKHTRNNLVYMVKPADTTVSDTLFRESKVIFSYVFSVLGSGICSSPSMVDAENNVLLNGGVYYGYTIYSTFGELWPVSNKLDLGMTIGLQSSVMMSEKDECTIVAFPEYNYSRIEKVFMYNPWQLELMFDFAARYNFSKRGYIILELGPGFDFMSCGGYLQYKIDNYDAFKLPFDGITGSLMLTGALEAGFSRSNFGCFLRVGYANNLYSIPSYVFFKDKEYDYNDTYIVKRGHNLSFLFGIRGFIPVVTKSKTYNTPNSLLKKRTEYVY